MPLCIKLIEVLKLTVPVESVSCILVRILRGSNIFFLNLKKYWMVSSFKNFQDGGYVFRKSPEGGYVFLKTPE